MTDTNLLDNRPPPRWIDGQALAARVRAELKRKVQEASERGLTPGLAVVRVGEDPASKSYVGAKVRACAEVGFHSRHISLPATTTEAELLDRIDALNRDPAIHGILVQLPLPPSIDEARVLGAIDPAKDADGFHPLNVGRLLLGLDAPVPCTPKGILRLLDEAGVDLRGKRVVVIGRSNIVGKPVALLLLARDASVAICHSKTADLPEEVRRADVIIAAVGCPALIKPDWIKPGAIIIDVGINRTAAGKLVGDVEPTCFDRATAMTPVPGGVGPMTVAMLLDNTFELFCRGLDYRSTVVEE
ncbi:MAG: bifunctional methylenetetrahydrofolate dehydrogenase/methenyltetrahydrofolate cyclohydrolase FolD [Myxococcales bacterium]|jgi:methylenetetrahydrofolate dehydrogenase (NADP+)/methenyltetrahydrofolate cyclohydrolase|nr:bifunctional methylenetetrahydrofolate dehydrogenase/methenyltetrahydrofolate cyclohydrolase FolD [Myxococcales bacterium]